MGIKFVTIGVYGFTETQFFEALQKANVDVLCDIRWRRGVRGAAYAFANHQRLKARLEDLGIRYLHFKDLAPNPDIRKRQTLKDKREKVKKRERLRLGPEFISAYREEVLSSFNPQAFISGLPEGAGVVALFCVEREPEACHRSLLADALKTASGAEVEHIKPD